MMTNKTPKTFILVHGAWHGSWCWHKIVENLKSLAHTVLTPDLPGHHLKPCDFKDVTLKSYVDHIEALVSASSHPVTLVGHSMGGIVITQVAENIPHKIEQLIYISGFIPQNGGSLTDEVKLAAVPTVAKEMTINVREASAGLPLQSHECIKQLFYANSNEEDIQYALSHLQKQPLRPFVDTISISAKCFGRVPKLYVECLQDQAIMIEDQRRMHSRVDCKVISLDTDHSPFFSMPGQLVQLIVN